MPQDYAESFMALRHMLRQGSGWSGHEKNCVFLNTGGPRFANISAVSGLDFSDDTRGVAAVDWDLDGDLDLWTSNRTGPRLRFLRNQNETDAHWLAFRLVGEQSNRDAIGARLELYWSGGAHMTRTLRAGEGFLSQSSKWVHFGLHHDTDIDRLVVHWPNGQQETITTLDVDGFYEIHEGQGAQRLPARQKLQLAKEPLQPQEVPSETRVVLASRVPAPPMKAVDLTGRAMDLQIFEGRPLLVNLWASWCSPCVKEMREFTERRKDIQKAGIEVIALSVDGVGKDAHGSSKEASELLRRLKFPFRVGFANEELLDMVGLVHGATVHTLQPFPIPTSLLIDPQGWLVAMYQGPVSVDQLLEDVATLTGEVASRRDLAVPFSGRWIDPPVFFDYLTEMGLDYLDAGFPQFSEHHYRMLLEQEPDHPQWLNYLGVALNVQKRYEDAAVVLRHALQGEPGQPEIQGHLGVALAYTSKEPEALGFLEQSLTALPDQPEAASLFGWILATDPRTGNRAREAVAWTERANQMTGFQDARMLDALAAAYARSGSFDRALTVVDKGIGQARALGQTRLMQEMQKRQVLYQRQKAYIRGSVPTP
jgi:peroxiredoxin/Flp pilus assembly protein TadD